jgi:hypothetical protein
MRGTGVVIVWRGVVIEYGKMSLESLEVEKRAG